MKKYIIGYTQFVKKNKHQLYVVGSIFSHDTRFRYFLYATIYQKILKVFTKFANNKAKTDLKKIKEYLRILKLIRRNVVFVLSEFAPREWTIRRIKKGIEVIKLHRS